jgi:hypothetical protein
LLLFGCLKRKTLYNRIDFRTENQLRTGAIPARATLVKYYANRPQPSKKRLSMAFQRTTYPNSLHFLDLWKTDPCHLNLHFCKALRFAARPFSNQRHRWAPCETSPSITVHFEPRHASPRFATLRPPEVTLGPGHRIIRCSSVLASDGFPGEKPMK